ncbi:hypothetical protein U1Q18_034186 [Sarracenia purpurea var. burkii]
MLTILRGKLRRFCSKLRWPIRRRPNPKVVIRKFGKSAAKARPDPNHDPVAKGSAAVHPNAHKPQKTIRIATFNAALFSMASAVPNSETSQTFDHGDDDDHSNDKQPINTNLRTKSENDRPKSILKQSPFHSSSRNASGNLSNNQRFAKSNLRVSINLPDNEISLGSSISLRSNFGSGGSDGRSYGKSRTVLEVLREVDADVLGLQDVKAEEEKGMKPLFDLAAGLGMDYCVFGESWAPEYGNAVLSKWPIKRWKVQKIFDDSDFRNVLKATIDVPQVGEVNFLCTHLDHLDENWRIKQINAIIQSSDGPHILAGGLNSLDETDYSPERWTDIVKYYEEMGKPTPKVEVMRFLKNKQYTDAKDFAGECESVVMIAKGQSVQGTCKYGTRVDYILASPDSPYKFVPGSYSVFSSKGTSDHHIVKVDISKVESYQQYATGKPRQPKHKIVKITNTSSPKGIWKTHINR